MIVNPKKKIRLKNRTNFFCPDKDRIYVEFGSSASYQSRVSKIEGYETRLYWQYRYCEDHDGQTFYYTLTYNNDALPKRYDTVCFDYEDLRDLLTGGFRKMLLRKYGTVFKYFIGAELGDGKGKRGLHNNPHYHVLFFLESDPDNKFPYKKILPKDFRHLVRIYWQGFDEDLGFRPYSQCKYGIAREGENLGLVTDFRACMYCAKYVCKDVKLKMNEENIERFLRIKYKDFYYHSESLAKRFFREKIYPLFGYSLGVDPLNSDALVFQALLPGRFDIFRDIFGNVPSEIFSKSYYNHVSEVNSKYGLWKEYGDFLQENIDFAVKLGLNEWRNRYCNKCRISHGVGDYALQFVQDRLCPTLAVPSKFGFKYRTPCLYYYRKLFTSVVIPIKFVGFGKRKGEVKHFDPVRVLNSDGVAFKVASLDSRISKLADSSLQVVKSVLSDPDLFAKVVGSDVNTDVYLPFSYYGKRKDSLFAAAKEYAVFKLVYQDRFFPFDSSRLDVPRDFPMLDYRKDYERFLQSSVAYVSRNDIMLNTFLEGGCEGYLPYSQHPDFLRYYSFFSLFDLCADYFFVKGDDKNQEDAQRIQNVKRFHDQLKLKKMYYGTEVF